MLGSLGWQELLIILAIVALLFGASRVADLGGALGRGIREFRHEASGEEKERARQAAEADTKPPVTPSATTPSSSDDRTGTAGT